MGPGPAGRLLRGRGLRERERGPAARRLAAAARTDLPRPRRAREGAGLPARTPAAAARLRGAPLCPRPPGPSFPGSPCRGPSVSPEGRGDWSLASRRPPRWGAAGPRPPPPPGPAGSQAPRTCERGGAVGVADVAVRRVDLLRVEDEDPEHGGADPWLAAPSSPRSPPRPGCPRGSACAPRTRSPPAAAALAASAEPQLSAQAADSRDDTALCTWRRPAGGRARTVRASLRGGAGRGGGLAPPLTLHLPRSAEPSRPPPPAAGTRALTAEPAAPPRAGRGTRAPAGGQALGRRFPEGRPPAEESH